MNPTQVREALESMGAKPNKRLGQHFLIDAYALETIVEEAEIEAGDHVLEIGPGLGVLTKPMLERGAHVTAIERDRRFAEYLSSTGDGASAFSRFREAESGRKARAAAGPVEPEIIQGDAAKLDWDEIMGEGEWKFVSNLPYAITSLALRKALWGKHPPTNIVVLIQREVAERIILRGRKKHSLLSLMVTFASHEARLVKRVSASCFFPPPKVESAILRIVPMSWEEREAIWGVHPETVMAVAKRGFTHPRKRLVSNLGLKGDDAARATRDAGLSENARAEDLAPEDWVRLAGLLESVKSPSK